MSAERGNDFARIVYQMLVVEKIQTLEQLAPKLGLTYDTLHARINSRVTFSANEIAAIIAEIPDLRLINYFLDNSPYIAVKRHDGATDLNDTVQRGATRSVLEASDVLREVERGLRDDKIDHQDKIRIKKEIASTERALAGLRSMLD